MDKIISKIYDEKCQQTFEKIYAFLAKNSLIFIEEEMGEEIFAIKRQDMKTALSLLSQETLDKAYSQKDVRHWNFSYFTATKDKIYYLDKSEKEPNIADFKLLTDIITNDKNNKTSSI